MIPKELDSIRKSVARSAPRPPNSFTVAEYAERYSLGLWTAGNQLRALVAAGKLKQSVALVNHKSVNVYWLP